LGARFKDSRGLRSPGVAAIKCSRIEDHGLKTDKTVANANNRGRLKSITPGMALPSSTHISHIPCQGANHVIWSGSGIGGCSFVDKTKAEKHFSGERNN
jgi:hypothetical protein